LRIHEGFVNRNNLVIFGSGFVWRAPKISSAGCYGWQHKGATEPALAMFNLPSIEVPLVTGTDGIALIQGTDVALEGVIAAYEDGASAEEIAACHDGLRLSDVYLVVSFYLKNRREVEAYLAGRHASAA
jgi:uncharacterized protein (DUF433 family)